jgi:hypothetical protein
VGKTSRRPGRAERRAAAEQQRLAPVVDAARAAVAAGELEAMAAVLAALPTKTRQRIEQEIGRPLAPPASITPGQEQALRDLWATLPSIECRGKCWDSCGPIRMSAPEHALTERAGYPIPDSVYDGNASLCPALTFLKQCAVYADRPSICRLWGISEGMPCNYGCVPDGGRLLTDRETWAVLAECFRIAGDTEAADQILDGWSTPERAAATDAMLKEGRESYDFRIAVHKQRAETRGGVIYVEGPGRLSKEPPRGVIQ